MTHSFDFPAVTEKLFVLRHLATGSRDYCREENILKGSHPYGDDEWRDYAFQLRRLISSYLIECAAKLRIFEDTASAQIKPSDIKEADLTAQRDCVIGKIQLGNKALSIRESCNKIIHATAVELIWANSTVKKPYHKFTFWAGKCVLQGRQGKAKWTVEINIVNWCAAVGFYLEQLWEFVDWDDYPYD